MMAGSRGLGVVASGHEAVSSAAETCLRAGGNAFDAAVAAGFASAAAEPMFTSLGGGGFLVARTGAGEEMLFDFFSDAPGRGLAKRDLEPHFVPVTVHFPASDQVFHAGLGSVAVPGTLRGLLEVHESRGRLPLAEVVAPTVDLARGGVVLNGHQAYVQGLLEPILTLTPAGRAIYTPAGRGLREGERLVNADLARFLEALPASADDLHAGAGAQRIAADMLEGGGLVTAADLAGYRVEQRAPLVIRYRGFRILTNPEPSLGGPLIAAALACLSQRDLRSLGWGSPAHCLALAEAMETAERVRSRPAAGGTTHVSVSDAEGNSVSMSLSNGEGSGYIVPGTGIMLNNMLGEDDLHPGGFHAAPPGVRVGSMMSPALALEGGRMRLVAGSGGSKRIRSAMIQVLTAVLDFDLSVDDAVEAPRIHWDGERFQVEPGIAPDALAALESRHPLNRWNERNLYFGGVHAVEPGRGAAGDPRRMGDGRAVGSET